MDRKEAIEIVRKNYPHIGTSVSEFETALRELVPELKESEDEKIRQALVRFFKHTHNWVNLKYDGDEIVAYLEKQKELPFVKDVILGFPGLYFYDGERMHFKGSPAMEEKQKEQKPVKLNDDTEVGLDRALQIVKKAKGNLCGYQSDDGIYECDHAIQTLERILKNGIEQKPAEWSDSVAKEMFIKALERAIEQTKSGYKLTDCDKHSWWEDFKAYSGINPAEWSEEDKRAIDRACVALRAYSNGDLPEFLPSELLGYADRLQSLRPQPHWKPSEEQMKALNKVANNGVLLDLFNDLLKLL